MVVGRLLFRKKRREEADAISTVPSGASVPPVEDVSQAAEEQRKSDRWWRGSSFELRHGLEVREMDAVPSELFDELFSEQAGGEPGRKR